MLALLHDREALYKVAMAIGPWDFEKEAAILEASFLDGISEVLAAQQGMVKRSVSGRVVGELLETAAGRAARRGVSDVLGEVGDAARAGYGNAPFLRSGKSKARGGGRPRATPESTPPQAPPAPEAVPGAAPAPVPADPALPEPAPQPAPSSHAPTPPTGGAAPGPTPGSAATPPSSQAASSVTPSAPELTDEQVLERLTRQMPGRSWWDMTKSFGIGGLGRSIHNAFSSKPKTLTEYLEGVAAKGGISQAGAARKLLQDPAELQHVKELLRSTSQNRHGLGALATGAGLYGGGKLLFGGGGDGAGGGGPLGSDNTLANNMLGLMLQGAGGYGAYQVAEQAGAPEWLQFLSGVGGFLGAGSLLR